MLTIIVFAFLLLYDLNIDLTTAYDMSSTSQNDDSTDLTNK